MSKTVSSKKDVATQREFRPIYTNAIKAHLQNRNWQKLYEVLVGGEQVNVNSRLLKKGWMRLAKHESEASHPIESIEHYAAARGHDLADIDLVRQIAIQMQKFFFDFQERFSKQDILGLLEPIDRLDSFHRIHQQQPIPEELKNLREDLRRRLEGAPAKIETPATPHVLRIFSSLYSDKMTADEVRAEFARIVVPLIRDEYEKRLREKKKAKKKSDPPKQRRKGKKM